MDKLPITVLIAAKNEEANLSKCLSALGDFSRVVLLDSQSDDRTPEVAARHGAEVVDFEYTGGYPKKRQWAIDHLTIETPWTFLLDADEVVTASLVNELRSELKNAQHDAYQVTKGFHFMGRRFRYGGFSHSAVLLFRTGKARFEHLFDEDQSALDMEVHERLIVEGSVGAFESPLIHEDFKGLQAYVDRHNHYSTWEAKARQMYLENGGWGHDVIQARLFGNNQERRRFLKQLALRLPFEPQAWFVWHYIVKMGFLEGRRGLIASRIRSNYIAEARSKLFELGLSLDRREVLPMPVEALETVDVVSSRAA